MQPKLASALNSPLFALGVLLAGVTINTCVSVHYAHKDSLAVESGVEQKAAAINVATLQRAKRLYLLRQYTDDGIRDIDTILRLYQHEHPRVRLPPPLEPEPNYDIDDVMPKTSATTEP